jgi:hypothetical protein
MPQLNQDESVLPSALSCNFACEVGYSDGVYLEINQDLHLLSEHPSKKEAHGSTRGQPVRGNSSQASRMTSL